MILLRIVPPKIVMESVLQSPIERIIILGSLERLFLTLNKIFIRNLQRLIKSPIESLKPLSLKPLSITKMLLVINVERNVILQNIVG